MAKSQIIKDIANSIIDTQTALKRTKVLLQELGNEQVLKWVDFEIEGYPDAKDVPNYRVIRGQLFGSYFKGSIAQHIQYKNISLPLGNMPTEEAEELLTAYITDGIGALQCMMQESIGNSNKELIKSLSADYFPYIANCNNDPYMMITSAYVSLSEPQLLNIFSKVENILLDILCYLEKEFGNLDDLDIDIKIKSKPKLKEIINNIQLIIYNDHRITMGDNNTIRQSTISED